MQVRNNVICAGKAHYDGCPVLMPRGGCREAVRFNDLWQWGPAPNSGETNRRLSLDDITLVQVCRAPVGEGRGGPSDP